MTIEVNNAEGIATIRIARPHKKNALTAAMYQSLADALWAADADPALHAVLLLGEPNIFTAGNDLEDFMQRPAEADDAPVFRFMRALLGCKLPVIAAVSGAAIGIGTTLLLHCDFVYLAEDARLVMPFVNLGLVPEFGSSLLVPRLMGHARAAEKLLLGEPMSAAEALACGIASAVLPADQLLPHAQRVARKLGGMPREALRETKRLLRAGTESALAAAMASEQQAFLERLRGAEAKEAFAAFFERRKPDFGKLTAPAGA